MQAEEQQVDTSDVHVFKISINVGNEKIAEIVSKTIAVDRELNEPIVEKSITNSHSSIITLLYKSKDPKKLRSAIKNTVENIMLSLQTIVRFQVDTCLDLISSE